MPPAWWMTCSLTSHQIRRAGVSEAALAHSPSPASPAAGSVSMFTSAPRRRGVHRRGAERPPSPADPGAQRRGGSSAPRHHPRAKSGGGLAIAGWPTTLSSRLRIRSPKNRSPWRGSAPPPCTAGSPSARAPGARIGRLGHDPEAAWVASTGLRHAHLDGFDLHANLSVPAADRARLGQLCRYLLRPPGGPGPAASAFSSLYGRQSQTAGDGRAVAQ